MRIKTSFEALDSTMTTVTAIVSDRMLQEDLKNVVIWLKEGKVFFAAYSGTTLSATLVDAQVDTEGVTHPEDFIQLKAKDINDILATFKGLKRTVISHVEFEIKENEAILHIFEEPSDPSIDQADSYRQESKFRVTKPRVKDLVKSEIQKINVDFQGPPIDNSVPLLYIGALLPTIAKETRESTNSLFFSDKYVYTFLAPYAAIMPNGLDPVFQGFRLNNTTVTFLKNFIQTEESFAMQKEVHPNGMVVLTVKVGNSVAVIKCSDMSRAFDISNFVTVPSNGLAVDKAYLLDVLKRVSLSSEATNIQIDIENGVGTFKIISKTMTQSLPVVEAKGQGSYHFMIKAELLSSVVFSHASDFGELVFLLFEHGDRGNIVMAVSDNTKLWHTKVTGLVAAKGDFAWA